VNASRLAGALAGAVLMAVAGVAAAQPAAGIGTNPPGSVFHAVGSGLTKAASDAGTLKLSIQPYAGSSTFMPLIGAGELEFGVNTSLEAVLAHRGPGFKIGGRNPLPHVPNLRLVMLGPTLTTAPLVRKDSPIRTVRDMRGKRVTGEYPAALTAWFSMFGFLASGQLTWSDVHVVPVPGVTDGVDALVQRRADVTLFALNGAKVREADAAVGVRHLSLDCSPDGEKRFRAAMPGYYTRRIKPGEAAAVVDEICVSASEIHVITGQQAPDAVVEGLLKAIWEHAERLPSLHPVFRDWTRAKLVTADATIPYHPAAVRFYRERGAWTPEIDQAQRRLAGTP
jgi:uncharacterized protein